MWEEQEIIAVHTIIQIIINTFLTVNSVAFQLTFCMPLQIGHSFWLETIKSNQFYLCRPKSQSHCLSGFYNLYSERHRLSSEPWLEWGGKNGKRWKKSQEEPQRRHPSSGTDRHAIEDTFTEQDDKKHSLKISSDTSKLYEIHVTCVDPGGWLSRPKNWISGL